MWAAGYRCPSLGHDHGSAALAGGHPCLLLSRTTRWLCHAASPESHETVGTGIVSPRKAGGVVELLGEPGDRPLCRLMQQVYTQSLRKG